MENSRKGTKYDGFDDCRYSCHSNQHSCNTVQYLYKISVKKATALPQGLWLLL